MCVCVCVCVCVCLSQLHPATTPIFIFTDKCEEKQTWRMYGWGKLYCSNSTWQAHVRIRFQSTTLSLSLSFPNPPAIHSPLYVFH